MNTGMHGVDPGSYGFSMWLLGLGHHEHMLKLDNGIGNENFDENLGKLKGCYQLDVLVAETGWATAQPTEDLYAKCKRTLTTSARSSRKNRARGGTPPRSP